MANKNLFTSKPGKAPRKANTRNHAGGAAFAFTPKHALAQYVMTGTLGGTFYASQKAELNKLLELASGLPTAYLAKVAIYGRKQGYMKDAPAFLVAMIASRMCIDPFKTKPILEAIFPRVIDNDRMLRNFVQIIRSGITGRKSLGTTPKRLIRQWFAQRKPETLFRSSVGKDPSLADVIRLARISVEGDNERTALQRYLLGMNRGKGKNEWRFKHLPPIVQEFEGFKKNPKGAPRVPDVPFQMLTGMPLTPKQWTGIAENGNWHFTRMNLNTFARHGVFRDTRVTKLICDRLCDEKQITRARVFPYQLLAAFKHADTVPQSVQIALQDAMEIATKNTPALDGNVWIFPDVSGSMNWSITGRRGTVTSKVACRDVAALFAACALRNATGECQVLPVDWKVHTNIKLNPRDSVMTNAQKLTTCGGGGTALSEALKYLINTKAKVDTAIFISDNESWADTWKSYAGRATMSRSFGSYVMDSTGKEAYWQKIKARNKNARMVCLDITANTSSQAPDQKDSILNIGGFNDNVWPVIGGFINGQGVDTWVAEIEKVDLTPKLDVH